MLKLAAKDLKLFFKDKKSLLMTFALPIALITLFAFAFGGVGRDKSASNEYKLPVCDLDNTASSKDAIKKLDAEKTLEVVHVNLNDAQEAIKKGKEDCVLIFYKGFADSLINGDVLPIELQYDEAEEIQVGMLQQALFKTISMLPYTGGGNTFVSMTKQFDKMLGKSDIKTKDKVHTQFDTLYKSLQKGIEQNPDTATSSNAEFGFGAEIKMTKLIAAKQDNIIGLIHAVAGTTIMMLLFSVAGMGASLLDEKQEGTLKKLLYSPIRPTDILYGKIIYANIISVIQLSIMFVFANIAFGLEIMKHIPSLFIMIIVTAYACSSFGVLLASFAKTRQQVQGLSTMIVMLMSCIGGSMVPIFMMPAFLQKISVFSVNYWGIQGFYDIFWRMLPISDLTFLSRILALVFIGTLLNFLAFRMFKKNILKIA